MVKMRKEIVNPLTFTVDTSYQMFQREGLSLVRNYSVAYIQVLIINAPKEETARRRSLHPSTIAGHIAEALYNGYHVDYRRG